MELIPNNANSSLAVEIKNRNQEKEFRNLCKKNDINCSYRYSKGVSEDKEPAYPVYYVFGEIDEKIYAGISYSKNSVLENKRVIESFKLFKKCIEVRMSLENKSS